MKEPIWKSGLGLVEVRIRIGEGTHLEIRIRIGEGTHLEVRIRIGDGTHLKVGIWTVLCRCIQSFDEQVRVLCSVQVYLKR